VITMTDSVETLSGPPSLATTFVKALFTGRGKSGRGPLPDTTLELAELAVDRDHLATYQRVCGWGVSDTLPHTYPHVLGFPLQATVMARGDFPLPLAGLVHLENVITVHRRLSADDLLTIAVHAESLRPHPKGTVVDLVTEVDSDGERVWDGRSTYLARGRSDADATVSEQAPMPTGVPAARWRLPGDLGRTYASVSGDVNPIHLFALTAKAMGFPARSPTACGPTPAPSRLWAPASTGRRRRTSGSASRSSCPAPSSSSSTGAARTGPTTSRPACGRRGSTRPSTWS
jgi:hypothetical protein